MGGGEQTAAINNGVVSDAGTGAAPAGVRQVSDGTYRDEFGNWVDSRGNPMYNSDGSLQQPFRVNVTAVDDAETDLVGGGGSGLDTLAPGAGTGGGGAHLNDGDPTDVLGVSEDDMSTEDQTTDFSGLDALASGAGTGGGGAHLGGGDPTDVSDTSWDIGGLLYDLATGAGTGGGGAHLNGGDPTGRLDNLQGQITNLSGGLSALSTNAQTQYDSLSSEQRALANQLVAAGASTEAAISQAATATADQITAIQTQLQGQISDVSGGLSTLSANVQSQYDSLSSEQRALANQLVASGASAEAAIAQAASATASQITAIQNSLQEQMADVSSSNAAAIADLGATSAANLTAAQQALNLQISNQGAATNSAIAASAAAQRAAQEQSAQAQRYAQLSAQEGAIVPGKLLTVGNMGKDMANYNLKQLYDSPAAAPASGFNYGDDTSPEMLNIAQLNSQAYQQPMYARGGLVYLAEGGQPDSSTRDVIKALKDMGSIGFDGKNIKPLLLQQGQMGGAYNPKILPQLAALLQARGMKLADGGQPDDHTHPNYDGIPLLRTGGLSGLGGKYVEGKGDGTSDDIAAMLANGEYVFSADVVSALGNGSNKSGAQELDKMVQAIRARARSAPPDQLPPDAKSPLEYLKSSKGKKHG